MGAANCKPSSLNLPLATCSPSSSSCKKIAKRKNNDFYSGGGILFCPSLSCLLFCNRAGLLLFKETIWWLFSPHFSFSGVGAHRVLPAVTEQWGACSVLCRPSGFPSWNNLEVVSPISANLNLGENCALGGWARPSGGPDTAGAGRGTWHTGGTETASTWGVRVETEEVVTAARLHPLTRSKVHPDLWAAAFGTALSLSGFPALRMKRTSSGRAHCWDVWGWGAFRIVSGESREDGTFQNSWI